MIWLDIPRIFHLLRYEGSLPKLSLWGLDPASGVMDDMFRQQANHFRPNRRNFASVAPCILVFPKVPYLRQPFYFSLLMILRQLPTQFTVMLTIPLFPFLLLYYLSSYCQFCSRPYFLQCIICSRSRTNLCLTFHQLSLLTSPRSILFHSRIPRTLPK